MVDPNPARGMPLQLQRYWLAGKGAAKIRWGLPHDFNRCVRQLRKYFPKNPEGLCNILHTKRLGAPPGKGHPGEASALTAAAALMARQPELGTHLWAGPLAPIGRDTEEPRGLRRFDPGALRHRALPLPLDWREKTGRGHDGAMTVGRILGITYGPDHMGNEFAYGWGDFLDEEVIPEARKARYLMEQGVAGASIDPGGRIVASIDPETGRQFMSEFTIGGATMVSIPAFSAMRLFSLDEEGYWPDDDEDLVMELLDDDEDGDCGCDGEKVERPRVIGMATSGTFSVNPDGWRGLPLAMRESVFDNDDAVKRIQAWATAEGGQVDQNKIRQAFLWHDDRQPPTVTQSYRLPVGDIINGRLTLIYHAIYAAAALISGAHGGLPDIPDQDKNQLREVISGIYKVMGEEFGDPNMRAPWENAAVGAAVSEGFKPQAPANPGNFAAETKEPYGDVEYADPGYRDATKRYPIDTPDHIRAAWSYINMPKNAKFYNADQLEQIKARIRAAAKKAGIQISEESMTASASGRYPLNPPKAWFDNPGLNGRTPLTVTEDGHVFGHIAAWNECHRDFNECVLAPKSQMGYRPFHLGHTVTAEGETIRVGKIMMDTRHADVRLGYAAASFHYDDTGDEVAIVRAGEDEYGVWVSGAIVPEATPNKVAKLRRSPISGDWRKVEGNLELVAALAVNVPAFPVYSMEGSDRFSLVAAGMVMPDPEDKIIDNDESNVTALVAALSATAEALVSDDEHQSLIERLADLADDEEIYAQRELAERFALLAAAEAPPAPAPAAPAPAAPAPAAPAPVAGAPAPAAPVPAPTPDQLAAMPEDQRISAMNAMSRFSIVEEPEGDANPPAEEAPAPAAATPAPAAPAPAAPAPVAPAA